MAVLCQDRNSAEESWKGNGVTCNHIEPVRGSDCGGTAAAHKGRQYALALMTLVSSQRARVAAAAVRPD